MLNHIVVMGRVVRDPEMRYTQSGKPVVSFTLAVERDFSQDKVTDFIDCVAWNKTAEFVSKYFRKGQMMIACGSLQSRKWEDRDGNKRTSWEIQAQNIYFGEAKKDSGNDGYGGGEPSYNPPTAHEAFDEIDDDGELPF